MIVHRSICPTRHRLTCSPLRASCPVAGCAQVLRLGNIVPDFAAQTTQGDMPSWHEWIEGSWAILFSHPADFTVCACHSSSPKPNFEPNPILVSCLATPSMPQLTDVNPDPDPRLLTRMLTLTTTLS